MSVHPYRQKMAQSEPSAPYPVSELDQFTLGQQTKGHSHTPEKATQLNMSDNAAINGSPRFNLAPLASSDNLNTGDIPDITHKLARNKAHAQFQDSNLSVSSIPQGQAQQDYASSQTASGSRSSSFVSSPHAPSPLNGAAHSRSFSSTSSMFLDRGETGPTFDLNQNVIQQHLGANSSHLMPRMKTIELYRKNAKKSSDPAVLFQYAQYTLQTALLLEEPASNTGTLASDTSHQSAVTAPATPSPKAADASKSHLRSTSSLSLDRPGVNSESDLRASLLKDALYYLRRLADKGYVDAQYLLGDAYSNGVFGKVDHKEAFSLFHSAAKHGHVECAFRTACCYEEGMGTGRDARKGVEFLKSAASKNHAAAMYKLGIYFFYARMGVSDSPVNKKLGIKWLERASNVATELTSAAPYELGKLYQSGYSDILIKDEKYALELFAQAAALGHVEASAILGHHYEMGNIVSADPNLSIHYYTKAALGGHAESMLAMCAWYVVGSEPYLPKDEPEAFEWAKRAASCGLGKAQFVLANFLDKGIGCEKNTSEAQKWYIQAAENGHDKALGRVEDKQKAAAITKKLKKSKKHVPPNTRNEAQEKDCVIM
ncbi:hypothetical protein JCM33374_g638 [Metschnikowia sp. JCM 33374]|nr:hypothetical protein JCM33374_g638 [Metschnikowia sp. JCM 33374]